MTGRIARSIARLGMGAAAMALIGAPLMAQGPTDAQLMGDAASTGDVLTYGMGPQAHRFSPLTTINSENVVKMVPAFSASLG
ncbi:MAG: PQQ-dependent dehydrogenase, methanol/ethanol family, partial [Sphingobium sp.]